jgi:transcriptional regulator with XRE-family HTH domain
MAAKKTLNETFAANLKALRQEKKLSQEAVAGKMKCSVSYVSMLERGQRSPPLDTIENVAKALGVPHARLLT